LDYAAATPLDPRVKKKMDEYLAQGGANPSGLYREGRAARKSLEDSRQTAAGLIGAKPHEIIFTSSTTESNNLAILGVARANKSQGKHVITTAVEHVSVLNPFKSLEEYGFEITYLPVDEYGRVSADQIKQAIRPDTILISVIFASNEIGTVNPIKEIGRGIRGMKRDEKGNSGLPVFFSDAAQAAPHIKINAPDFGLDMMSFSAGKIYGPKGAAALYVRTGIKINPIMLGGSQENGLRPGTQDMTGIVGLAEAIKIVELEGKKEDARLAEWRDKIVTEVTFALPEVLLNGHPKDRLANNVSFSIPGLKAEELVLAMDERGFALSTRSACDAKNPTPPHVIKAIGRSDEAAWGTVRVTLGRLTTLEDVERFIETFVNEVKKLKNTKS
ncbi:MAG: cysteine desulfurase, partial [Candidatus Sungbacteria bacterium]|nr:cysteine desulfurase [Candidatus Sungbacteria bacterium]